MHPVLTAGLVAGGGVAIAALAGSWLAKTGKKGHRQLETGSFKESKGRQFMDTNMNISEHMEVVGSDGMHVGTVDKVEGSQIKLTKDDSPDGKHHLIPVNDVDSVKQNRVMLAQTATDAKANWQSA